MTDPQIFDQLDERGRAAGRTLLERAGARTRPGFDTDLAAALRGVRVKRLELTPGRIDAQFQDREIGAATVAICIPVLSDEQWEKVLTALASQAIFAAQLLAGEMPPELEQIFAQAGAELLPLTAGAITHTCSACPAWTCARTSRGTTGMRQASCCCP